MRQSNTEMFESKQRTHERIQSGEYMRFLEDFWPKLRDWKDRFGRTEGKSPSDDHRIDVWLIQEKCRQKLARYY